MIRAAADRRVKVVLAHPCWQDEQSTVHSHKGNNGGRLARRREMETQPRRARDHPGSAAIGRAQADPFVLDLFEMDRRIIFRDVEAEVRR